VNPLDEETPCHGNGDAGGVDWLYPPARRIHWRRLWVSALVALLVLLTLAFWLHASPCRVPAPPARPTVVILNGRRADLEDLPPGVVARIVTDPWGRIVLIDATSPR
jgi:hypothetical protein